MNTNFSPRHFLRLVSLREHRLICRNGAPREDHDIALAAESVGGSNLQQGIAQSRTQTHDRLMQTAGSAAALNLTGGVHDTHNPPTGGNTSSNNSQNSTHNPQTNSQQGPSNPTNNPQNNPQNNSQTPDHSHENPQQGGDQEPSHSGSRAESHGKPEDISLYEHLKSVFSPNEGKTHWQEFCDLGTAFRKNYVKPGVGLGITTGIVSGGSALAELPVLGKIPYLPAIAQGIQNGITTATTYLGMNTGAAATNSYLSSYVPHALPLLGPINLGAVAVAGAGLYGLGWLNEFATQWTTKPPRKSGINVFKTMWHGVRAPVDLPIAALKGTGIGIAKGYKYLFGDKKHSTKGAVMTGLNFMGRTAKKHIRAVGVGTAAAVFLAPATGGSSLLWGVTGFAGTKIAEAYGWIGASKKSTEAAAPAGH